MVRAGATARGQAAPAAARRLSAQVAAARGGSTRSALAVAPSTSAASTARRWPRSNPPPRPAPAVACSGTWRGAWRQPRRSRRRSVHANAAAAPPDCWLFLLGGALIPNSESQSLGISKSDILRLTVAPILVLDVTARNNLTEARSQTPTSLGITPI